jgi:hypothetical protein
MVALCEFECWFVWTTTLHMYNIYVQDTHTHTHTRTHTHTPYIHVLLHYRCHQNRFRHGNIRQHTSAHVSIPS